MNLLQQYPHLFANGKFKASYDEEIFRITGYNEYLRVDDWELRFSLYNKNRATGCNITDCTLIARPISDMTDEEIERREYLQHSEETGYSAGSYHYRLIDSPESMLYLLSIGVYPFDQSHFEDGTVQTRYRHES